MVWYLTTTKATGHFGGKGAVVKVFVDGELFKAMEALHDFVKKYGNMFELVDR